MEWKNRRFEPEFLIYSSDANAKSDILDTDRTQAQLKLFVK